MGDCAIKKHVTTTITTPATVAIIIITIIISKISGGDFFQLINTAYCFEPTQKGVFWEKIISSSVLKL